MNVKRQLKKIRKGDEAAAEELIRFFYRDIYIFVYSKTGDEHHAYDMTQEIFIKMIRSLSSFRDDGRFKSWLFTIAANHTKDYYKSNLYRERKQSVTEPFGFEENVVTFYSRSSSVLDEEDVGILLNDLPGFQKEAILLKYIYGFKGKEISAITGVPESSVKSRIRQGLEKMRNKVKGENADE
ncbi:RNA polymerase sigma factor [Alteribacter natronophilus]|uniref:RNA polymerase sigma factor n=1 Tax=Alteribacter natronophilus TaxID=2583810 RepID=UPI00110D9D8E|nr:RNA polymerase sigma factor [Alteribacter natronophilus]TMW70364.1 RNA polymerase sigma factor [Alteribacter natronophilus]